MGPGGLRGLQILLPGANHARGGFDSHASPPCLRRVVPALAVFGCLALNFAGTAGAAAPDSLAQWQSPGQAALKSFVLPGWGQAGNGQWLKSGIFFGAYAGLLAWGISLNQEKQDAVGSLHAAPDSLQGYWEAEVSRLDDSRNAKYWFAGATLLLSVVDAYVDAHLRGFDDRIDAEVGWMPEDGGAFALVIRTRWDWESNDDR